MSLRCFCAFFSFVQGSLDISLLARWLLLLYSLPSGVLFSHIVGRGNSHQPASFSAQKKMTTSALQTRGIKSSLHHVSGTLTRPIQSKEFRVHVVFNGFPTSPPTGASWLFSTWKLEMPISSISRFGLFWTRVDLWGISKLCVGDMSVVSVGIDSGIQERKNLLLQTRTLPPLRPVEVALVWAYVCDCSIYVPQFCFTIL